MSKVILYVRVSTKEQGSSGLGIEAQIVEGKRFAAANKLEVVDVRAEVVSGKYDLDRRPVLKKAFRDALAIPNCAVLTTKIDRLSRSAAFIMNIMEKGVQFIVAECGINASPLMIHLRAIVAEDERRKIGERTKAAFSVKRAKGDLMGFKLPAVGKVQRTAVERGVATIKAEANAFSFHVKPVIQRMHKTGMSLQAIAKELNEQGNKTARGGKWYAKTVSNIMERW